jgi:2-dehydro-3-deoxygluconokinase
LNLEEEKQMGKFITFGEIMLRLAPMNYDRFLQSKEFGVVYGGGEANVAVSLANYGKDAYFVTKLPTHEIGQSAVNELRRYGVDTSNIVRGGERVGIYFCEKGASQRPSKVIYDRAHSAIAEAKREDFNWKEIFADAEWFHFTGITPALSDECAAITLDAVKAAKEAGVTVSVDLNFRKKLWSSEKAGRVMGEIVKYCDVVIANEEDAEKVFGISAEETDITGGTLSNEGYQNVAKQLVERFDLKYVAITLRESFSASDNGWSAMLYDGKEFYNSKKYKMHIVDRVGGGDSFGAGLIYGLTSGLSNQDSLEYAVAASCLKHTVEGDFNLVSIEEVETLMKGDASGRVQR